MGWSPEVGARHRWWPEGGRVVVKGQVKVVVDDLNIGLDDEDNGIFVQKYSIDLKPKPKLFYDVFLRLN